MIDFLLGVVVGAIIVLCCHFYYREEIKRLKFAHFPKSIMDLAIAIGADIREIQDRLDVLEGDKK